MNVLLWLYKAIFERVLMIYRSMLKKFMSLVGQFPVVGVVGPRQSGKTTLVKNALPDYAYVTMEDLDMRALAQQDPRRFFAKYKNEKGVIIDEVQEAPDLLSYMQAIVDEQDRPGQFILTGSQNILVHEKISQTLAGRIALLTLLPLSVEEFKNEKILPASIEELLIKGCYPRIYAKNIDYEDWFLNYVSTYLERDVRQIVKVFNLTTFQRFLKLCAGRIGQILNYTSFANDCGISPNTAKEWLSILQASYIVFLAHPYFKNFNKRVIKSPKLYFYDTGLACFLLEVEDSGQLFTHYMRGAIFESFVMSEIVKYHFNVGKKPNLYFWRDVQGNEVDAILTYGQTILPIEIKSGLTINSRFFDGIKYWDKITKDFSQKGYIVYAGQEEFERKEGEIVSWDNVKSIVDKIIK